MKDPPVGLEIAFFKVLEIHLNQRCIPCLTHGADLDIGVLDLLKGIPCNLLVSVLGETQSKESANIKTGIRAIPRATHSSDITEMQDGDRRTVQFGSKGKRLRVEISASSGALRQGLMFRDSLPEGQGMLFIFPKPSVYSMWMMNMQIPLDIIWMDQDMKVIAI